MNPAASFPAQYPTDLPVIGPDPAGPVLSPLGISLLPQFYLEYSQLNIMNIFSFVNPYL
jgi:hypothetical protein